VSPSKLASRVVLRSRARHLQKYRAAVGGKKSEGPFYLSAQQSTAKREKAISRQQQKKKRKFLYSRLPRRRPIKSGKEEEGNRLKKERDGEGKLQRPGQTNAAKEFTPRPGQGKRENFFYDETARGRMVRRRRGGKTGESQQRQTIMEKFKRSGKRPAADCTGNRPCKAGERERGGAFYVQDPCRPDRAQARALGEVTPPFFQERREDHMSEEDTGGGKARGKRDQPKAAQRNCSRAKKTGQFVRRGKKE